MTRPVRELLADGAPVVAPTLLGWSIVTDDVRATIVETEAYRQDDPASHSCGADGRPLRTARTEVMFGAPGHAYVYRSYGVHWCLNVSCEPAGVGAAVLLRAARVEAGQELVRQRRRAARRTDAPVIRDRDLLRGPGNLCRGLAIDASLDGADLLSPRGSVRLVPPRTPLDPARIRTGPRVGVRLGADVPWRFWIADAAEVSRYARSPRAPRA